MALPQKTYLKEVNSKTDNFFDAISFSTIPHFLEQKKSIFLQKEEEIIGFLRTDHKAKEALALEKDIDQHINDLIKIQRVLDARKNDAANNCEQQKLYDQTAKEIKQDFKALASELREDRRALEQKEKDLAFDPFKFFTGLFIAPVAAGLFCKAQFPKQEDLALNVQICVAVWGTFHSLRHNIKYGCKVVAKKLTPKKISNGVRMAWGSAIKDITPRDINNSFLVYYIKTESAEKAQKAGQAIRKAMRISVIKMEAQEPMRGGKLSKKSSKLENKPK